MISTLTRHQRLIGITAILNGSEIPATFERPDCVQLQIDRERYVAATFEGGIFRVSVEFVSGRATKLVSSYGEDRGDGFLALAVAMASKEFAPISTGGGCEAFCRTIGLIEYLLTDDADLPDGLDGPCTLSCNKSGEMESFAEYTSVLEFLKAIDAVIPEPLRIEASAQRGNETLSLYVRMSRGESESPEIEDFRAAFGKLGTDFLQADKIRAAHSRTDPLSRAGFQDLMAGAWRNFEGP